MYHNPTAMTEDSLCTPVGFCVVVPETDTITIIPNEESRKNPVGCFLKSKDIADIQGFISPQHPGSLPLALQIHGDTYCLLRRQHPGVCDEEGCQLEFNHNPELSMFYCLAPIYSMGLSHELCLHCATVSHNGTPIGMTEQLTRLEAEWCY